MIAPRGLHFGGPAAQGVLVRLEATLTPTRSNPAATLLFWLMFLSAGSSLAACLLLPVWLEYRALRGVYASTNERIVEMQERLVAYDHQIDHLLNDPAYIERLARQEFGFGESSENVVFVAADEAELPASAPATAPAAQDRVEQVSAYVERAAAGNPLVSLFIRPETRPVVMSLSGLVLVIAVVTLNWPRSRPPPA